MQEVCAFHVLVSAASLSYAVFANDRDVVQYIFPKPDDINICGFLSHDTFGEKCLGIVGKGFVYPHVCFFFGRDVVPEPFVAAFMNDDEVPVKPDACS